MKTIIILAHPKLEDSIANQHIATSLKKQYENIEIRNLTALYPNYKIDVATEQAALLTAQNIIFQYPFYWYNMPSILKEWFDQVFCFNFAFGPEGNKLKDKNFILSFTIGGPADSYTPLGYNHFKVEDFLKPLEQTAYLAQMNYLKPIYQHGMVYIPGVYNTVETVKERADQQVKEIANLLYSLENQNPEDKIKTFVTQWFAQFDALAEDGYFNKYIANNAQLQFVEGTYQGHKGFSQWYASIKKRLKANCEHRVESIQITEENKRYYIDLSIKLKAETYSNEQIELNIKEHWAIEITRDNRIKILEIIAKPV